MTFRSFDFDNFVASESETAQRLFRQYDGASSDFDIIIVGSGMGGGILADDLADRVGDRKRILILEAGSYLFPTHVYNTCRFGNADVASSFACKSFWQQSEDTNAEHYIHERPQLNFGGRSVFWSGLIPTPQPWELHFFPNQVRAALSPSALQAAGERMTASITLGRFAERIANHLGSTGLGQDFLIEETPRALHQPYLDPTGVPSDRFFLEPTGVFNTAELLVNQLGRPQDPNTNRLHLRLNQYVEDLQTTAHGWYGVFARDTTTGQARTFYAPQVVLAAGSIESPKLVNRSTLGRSLPANVQSLVGRGLTDHPTTDGQAFAVSHCGTIAIPKDQHAKIIMYSKDERGTNPMRFPFNVEININHEYWHTRNNDPVDEMPSLTDDSVLDFKFSFANCLDGDNRVHHAAPFQYVPEVEFKNLHWTSHVEGRFAQLAGWQKSASEIFQVLNDVGNRLLAEFSNNGTTLAPTSGLGDNGLGFGRGTVHHAIGTMRMPYRPALGAGIEHNSVVDEDLQIKGAPNLYVCDMSVMPLSQAANPVRALAALALRLSRHMAP